MHRIWWEIVSWWCDSATSQPVHPGVPTSSACIFKNEAQSNPIQVCVFERLRENRKSKRWTSIDGARNHVLWFRSAHDEIALSAGANRVDGSRRSSGYRQVLLASLAFSIDRIRLAPSVRPLTPRAPPVRRWLPVFSASMPERIATCSRLRRVGTLRWRRKDLADLFCFIVKDRLDEIQPFVTCRSRSLLRVYTVIIM